MDRLHPPKRIFSVKLLAYVVGGFAGVVVGLLLIGLIRGNRIPEDSPLLMFALILLFAIAPFGAIWMVKTTIRRESTPAPLIFVAVLVPFAFLWYYFERIRPCTSTEASADE